MNRDYPAHCIHRNRDEPEYCIHRNRDPILQSLPDSGHGLKVFGYWYGALAFADDMILLSTTISGLQNMVDICAKHAEDNDLVFSTHIDTTKSKTMCIAFKPKVKRENLPPVFLNGDVLPWKELKVWEKINSHRKHLIHGTNE